MTDKSPQNEDNYDVKKDNEPENVQKNEMVEDSHLIEENGSTPLYDEINSEPMTMSSCIDEMPENCIEENLEPRDDGIDILEIFDQSEMRELLVAETNTTTPVLKVEKRTRKQEGIYINGKINGVKVVITVDTGAARTVLSRNAYLKIKEEVRPPLVESSSLIGADGHPLEELGTANFNVELGNYKFEKELVVAQIDDDVLLGLDILMVGKMGPAEIKLADRNLILNGEVIPFKFSRSFNKVRNVVAADDAVIPACSELILDVYVEKTDLDSWFSQQEFIIEPSSSFMERSSLLIATSLVDLSKSITGKMRLMNPLKTDVTIHQNTVIGVAELNEDKIVPLFTPDNEEQEHGTIRRLQLHSEENTFEKNLREQDVIKHVPRQRPESKPNIENVEADKVVQVPPHLIDIFNKIQTGRSETEIKEIASLFSDYGDVFSKNDEDLGVTNIMSHSIETGSARPIKQHPRRVPLAFADKEKEIIQQMEKQGVIRKSTSPWASPLCLVLKKSGKIRPCIDYRQLNKVTENDAFPLPRVQDCLDTVSGSTLFTTVDMLSSYHQVPVKETDIPKTAFVTKYGLYEFTRMPMGLKSSAQTFQRVMELALQGLQWSICLIYLDDIIIFSKTFEQHMERLRLVLQRIRDAGLKIKPEKCQFLQPEVAFLGHVVSKDGVRPNPDNLMKIKQWSQPKSVTQVRQFIGLASYYRRHVKDFSKIVAPMVQLTKKGENFIWSEECEEAFSKIKSLLIQAPIMAYPLDDGEYILDTDASDVGIGAVLSQIQDGQEKTIAYGSRTLNKAERNYCVTDKELLALRYFVEYYRQYLLGRKFIIRTDHQALVWLFSLKEPKGRIARWIEILSSYDFTILHRPGKKHGNADGMSRCPLPNECLCAEVDTLECLKCGPCKKCVKRSKDMESLLYTEPQDGPVPDQPVRAVTRSDIANQENKYWTTWRESYAPEKLSKLQQNDPDISLLLDCLKKQQKPAVADLGLCSPASRHYFNLWDSLTLVNNVVYKKFLQHNGAVQNLQLLTPSCLKREILKLAHDSLLSGHFGRKKTLEKTRREFYWYEMREDVEVYLTKCDVCAKSKYPTKKPKAPLGSIPVGAPLDKLSVDIVGPLPRTPRNNRFFLTVTCNFTKWTEVYPIPDQTAETCAQKILDEFISRFGCVESIHSDQGGSFESDIFKQMCKLLEIKKTRTSARNPKGNGQCERVHRTILQMIRAYLKGDQTEWDQHLGCIMAAYRSCINESTGFSPNMMMLGREVKTPLNLVVGFNRTDHTSTYGEYVSRLREQMKLSHEICRNYMLKTSKRRKDQYDIKTNMNCYKTGDAVWFLNEQRREGVCQKLQPLYIGPCVILNKFNNLNYCIQTEENGLTKVVNHDKLKPYKGDNYPKWGAAAVRAYNRRRNQIK